MDPSTVLIFVLLGLFIGLLFLGVPVGFSLGGSAMAVTTIAVVLDQVFGVYTCLLYTSPSPRDGLLSRMPSSA